MPAIWQQEDKDPKLILRRYFSEILACGEAATQCTDQGSCQPSGAFAAISNSRYQDLSALILTGNSSASVEISSQRCHSIKERLCEHPNENTM